MSENLPNKRGRKPAIKVEDAFAEVAGAFALTEPVIQEEEKFLDAQVEIEIRKEFLIEKRKLNEILDENKELRKTYAIRLFILTCIWAALIFVLIFFIGFKAWGFELSDKVIITLITSTTINFFGFFLLVVRYLFNTANSESTGVKRRSSTLKSKSK